MEELMKSLRDILLGLKHPRVLVVGDLILDKYVWGETSRISPEAPVPVLLMREQESRPGGAGNVVNALAGLEAIVNCCGVVGDDADGRELSAMIKSECGDLTDIPINRNRPTIVKTRFVGYVQSAHRAMHHMLRVDSEDSSPVDSDTISKLAAFVKKAIPEHDVVIISDYGKGLLTAELTEALIDRCRQMDVPVIVDPCMNRDYRVYQGADCITPNRYETQLATGIALDSEEDMKAAARKLQGSIELNTVIITLDRDGMYLYETEKKNGKKRVRKSERVPTHPREVYDVTGAGDMVVSVLAMMVGAGVDYRSAVEIANIAAGLEVGKVGAALVTRQEIMGEIQARDGGLPHKLKELPELLRLLDEHRRKREKIVFTNGCFDLLHMGHIEYLKFSRKQGDLLVVGINSDRSVQELKGPNRPILAQNDRAQVLAGLEDIDYIVVFDETTPDELIRKVRPDVLVKGEDWREKGVVGRDFVESYGGQVVLAPLVKGISTTDIVSRIINRYGNNSDENPDSAGAENESGEAEN